MVVHGIMVIMVVRIDNLGGLKMGEFKVLVDAWQASPSLMAQAVLVLPLVVTGAVLISVIVGWLLRRLI